MPVEILPEVTFVFPKDLFAGISWNISILIDIDGVICEYDFPRIVKEKFDILLDPESIFAYDLADVLGVSPVDIDNMFRGQVYGPARFIKGSLEVLNQWQDKGYDIEIFSNRVKYMGKDGLIQWLIGNNIPFNGIDLNGKGRYDYHIDDSPGKLASTDSLHKILFNHPWNRRCLDIHKLFNRVFSWEEIKTLVS